MYMNDVSPKAWKKFVATHPCTLSFKSRSDNKREFILSSKIE